MELIFATHNKHKLEEVKHILNHKVDLLSLTDVSCFEEIPENEETLEGNAIYKAQYIHNKFQRNCFSDDTGLEVVALNGAPGVYSARYGGEGHNDELNRAKLLKELRNKEDRSAQFRTVVALFWEGSMHLFEGIVEGEISCEERGTNGFGYDSLFVPKGYNRTFAQMTEEEKNGISHRGRAIEKLSLFIDKQMGSVD